MSSSNSNTNPIRMQANENAIGPSPLAVEAMTQAVLKANRYPPYLDDDLRESLAAYHGRGLTADQFVTCNSGSEVIEFVFRRLLRAGDNIIVCSPTFGLYFRMAQTYGVDVRDVPLTMPGFDLDLPQILATIDDKTKLLVLINPNNPTGTVVSKDKYEALLDRLPPHVTLLADDAYGHYADPAVLPDIIGPIQAGKNVIQLYSFSKAFGMAGLRLGYAITTAEQAAELRAIHRAFHINAVSFFGAQAVLKDEAYLQASVQNAQEGLAYLYAAFDRLGIRYWTSQTNFVMIETGLESADLVAKLAARGILVRHPKDRMIARCVRITVGLPEENEALVAALEVILG